MSTEPPRYVFGPVPSRRLGRSLGVDLVPFKTCSHDCVYCQLGRTTNQTVERAEYAPTDVIVEQLRAVLAGPDRPDSITLAGSGEPTLHSRIGEVIAAIKTLTDVPVTILTNGSLFDQPDVRRECIRADRIVPSLDAGSEAVFRAVNRPASGLTLARHVDGLVALRHVFDGQLWLEIMVVAGLNDSDEEIGRMGALADRIRPDRIQLNTVIRPPSDADARAVERDRMDEIADLLGPLAEVIADYDAASVPSDAARKERDVQAMLERRPCTLSDVAAGLGIHRNEAIKYLQHLLDAGTIAQRPRGGQDFYEATSRGGSAPPTDRDTT